MRMVPDNLTDLPDSESIVFETLKKGGANWTVYPKFRAANRGNESRPRELDFVILIPRHGTVICLEAKGGHYDYQGRSWLRRGSPGPVVPSPTEQAESGMFDLKNQWEQVYKPTDGTLLNFLNCVVFTDCELDPSLLAEPFSEDILGTSKLIGASIAKDSEQLVYELGRYASKTRKELLGYDLERDEDRRKAALTELGHVEDELERMMELMEAPRSITDDRFFRTNLNDLLPELLKPTPEQKMVLSLAGVNRRCVIDGAAGTGKTVVAMELARQRCEEDDETVGFMCSNRYLSQRCSAWSEILATANGGRVVVGAPASIVSAAYPGDQALQERLQRLQDDSELLTSSLRRGALAEGWGDFVDATDKIITEHSLQPVFDTLIVDEAQNLCDEEFLLLMDRLLKGGLESGKWVMFGDFENQDLVTPRRRQDRVKAIDRLRDEYNATRFRLDTNCRNTAQIADATSRICNIATPTLSGVSGPEVKFHYFDSTDQISSLLDQELQRWQSLDFDNHQVILLTTGDTEVFSLDQQYAGWRLLNIADAPMATPGDPIRTGADRARNDRTVLFSDVHDFQGLESDLVILILTVSEDQTASRFGVTMPDFDYAARLLYTGMSRANVVLSIIADQSYQTFLEPEGLP